VGSRDLRADVMFEVRLDVYQLMCEMGWSIHTVRM